MSETGPGVGRPGGSAVKIPGLMHMRPQQPHILIRGTNWLGDAVMTIPALRRARSGFASAHISLLTSPGAASLFLDSGLVDEVLIYHRKERGVSEFLRTINDLRRREFDLAILFQQAFEAALLAYLAGIPQRIGHFTQGRSWMLTAGLDPRNGPRPRHQSEDYIELVELALDLLPDESAPHQPGDSLPPSSETRLEASSIQQTAAAELLDELGIGSNPGIGRNQAAIVALNVGAVNSRAKRWPVERFAELADRLMEEFGALVLLTGAPSEREIASNVESRMRTRGAINLAGKTDLDALIGLLARCDLVISNDTGSAHVAAALGRPTITIFGPTNEFETAPRGPRAEIARADGVSCARCMLRDCPIDHRCMWQITADHLIELARPHLASFNLTA